MAAVAIGGWLMGTLLVAAPVPEPAAPSRELLLYLAEFEDADGNFVDPLEVRLQAPDAADRADAELLDVTDPTGPAPAHEPRQRRLP